MSAIALLDVVLVVVATLAALPLVVALRLATGARQQRLELVAAGILGAVAVALVGGWLGLLDSFEHADIVVLAGLGLVPLAASAGLVPAVRRRAEAVLRAGLVVLALAVVVVVAQLVVILVAGELPNVRERSVLALGLLGAAVAAVAFRPLARRMLVAALRLVRGERRRPEDVVAGFGARAASGVPDTELLLQLAESMRRTMRLQRAEVWTGAGGWLERTVSVPDQPGVTLHLTDAEVAAFTGAGVVGESWLALWQPDVLAGRPPGSQVRVVPAAHSGAVLGLVIAQRPPDADGFAPDDDRALAELGRRLGVVLRNRQLDATLRSTLDDLRVTNDELRASRSRLVAAADGERNRIERNLHDGAQQHLVALALNVSIVRDVLDEDPAAAGTMLDELATDVKAAVEELRTLAHGIYPPLLREAGLGEALRAAGARAGQPVRVRVGEQGEPGQHAEPGKLAEPSAAGGGIGRYPQESEAAIYFCCMEALANSAKHAPAATVDVRVWRDGDRLRFVVTDDGPGFDLDTVTRGHGLQHMADRLGAVGGAVEWDSAPGAGATVRGWVPT